MNGLIKYQGEKLESYKTENHSEQRQLNKWSDDLLVTSVGGGHHIQRKTFIGRIIPANQSLAMHFGFSFFQTKHSKQGCMLLIATLSPAFEIGIKV